MFQLLSDGFPKQAGSGCHGILQETVEHNSTLPSRPGIALRHREVTVCPEVADSVDAKAKDAPKRQLISTLTIHISLMTPTIDLGRSRYVKPRA